MLRWSKPMPHFRAEFRRSSPVKFGDAKRMADPDALCAPAAPRSIGRSRDPKIQERNAIIRERYANGDPVWVIAEENELSEIRIRQICKGVERRAKPKRRMKPKNEERNNAIRERFANGETAKAIAKDYEIGKFRVYEICNGVERRVKQKEERNRAIRERFANGETGKTIAKDYVISPLRVYQICKGVVRRVKPKRGMKPKNEERNNLMRERFANWETLAAIGSDYGITRQCVSVICKGVERRVKPKRVLKPRNEERNNAIRERFANGEPLAAIGNDYGISCPRVSVICKGVERRVKPKEERNNAIRERFANWEAAKAIAKDYGISPVRVYRICKGVERKPIRS